MTTKEKVKLNPDVFDALELSALAYGGVGAGCLFQEGALDEEKDECGISAPPSCIMGHAMFLDGLVLGTDGEGSIDSDRHPVCAELIRVFPALLAAVTDEGIREEASDMGSNAYGVEAVNDRSVEKVLDAHPGKSTVSFKKWCQLMNVVRGDQ